MKSFKQKAKMSHEVIQTIRASELELENLVNKYRFFLITFLLITIFANMYYYGVLSRSHAIVNIPLIVLVYAGMVQLHFITKKKKSIPLLKYITVTCDYLALFGLAYEGRASIAELAGITMQQYAIMVSIFIITINSFSALRIQLGVILFSTIVGLCLNGVVHHLWGSNIYVGFYTGVFIAVSGFFNVFIAGFIFRSYMLNHQLSVALKDVEVASREISAKNNEINAKNEELEVQNESLFNQHAEITKQKKQIVSSIQYASRIQNAVLNTADAIAEVAPDSFIFYKPRNIVSGDFYWFRKVDVFTNEYSVFAAVDCTGHGVPGAFMSMLGTSFLNDIVTEFYTELNAADILDRMREKVKKHLQQGESSIMVKDGMDMAICAIDYKQMELQFAGANSPLFIVRYGSNGYASEVEEVLPDRMPIGVYAKERPFTNNRVAVCKGDLLYLFSDGFVDQFGGEVGDKFKKKQFRELLVEIAHLPMPEQRNAIEQRFESWKGDKYNQVDDVTVIGVRV